MVVAVGKMAGEVLYVRKEESAEDEPVFVEIGTESDEEDGEHDKGEESPSDYNDFADVEFGHIESVGVTGVESLFVDTDFTTAFEEENDAHNDCHRREDNLIPKNHEVVGAVTGDPRDAAVFEHVLAHGLIAGRVDAEGTDGEADGEEEWDEKDAPLLECGTAGAGEGTDGDVVHGQAGDGGQFEQIVVEEQAAGLSAEIDTGDGDGEGVDH